LNSGFKAKTYFLNNEKDDIEIKFITVDLQKDFNKESVKNIANELKDKIISG